MITVHPESGHSLAIAMIHHFENSTARNASVTSFQSRPCLAAPIKRCTHWATDSSKSGQSTTKQREAPWFREAGTARRTIPGIPDRLLQ